MKEAVRRALFPSPVWDSLAAFSSESVKQRSFRPSDKNQRRSTKARVLQPVSTLVDPNEVCDSLQQLSNNENAVNLDTKENDDGNLGKTSRTNRASSKTGIMESVLATLSNQNSRQPDFSGRGAVHARRRGRRRGKFEKMASDDDDEEEERMEIEGQREGVDDKTSSREELVEDPKSGGILMCLGNLTLDAGDTTAPKVQRKVSYTYKEPVPRKVSRGTRSVSVLQQWTSNTQNRASEKDRKQKKRASKNASCMTLQGLSAFAFERDDENTAQAEEELPLFQASSSSDDPPKMLRNKSVSCLSPTIRVDPPAPLRSTRCGGMRLDGGLSSFLQKPEPTLDVPTKGRRFVKIRNTKQEEKEWVEEMKQEEKLRNAEEDRTKTLRGIGLETTPSDRNETLPQTPPSRRSKRVSSGRVASPITTTSSMKRKNDKQSPVRHVSSGALTGNEMQVGLDPSESNLPCSTVKPSPSKNISFDDLSSLEGYSPVAMNLKRNRGKGPRPGDDYWYDSSHQCGPTEKSDSLPADDSKEDKKTLQNKIDEVINESEKKKSSETSREDSKDSDNQGATKDHIPILLKEVERHLQADSITSVQEKPVKAYCDQKTTESMEMSVDSDVYIEDDKDRTISESNKVIAEATGRLNEVEGGVGNTFNGKFVEVEKGNVSDSFEVPDQVICVAEDNLVASSPNDSPKTDSDSMTGSTTESSLDNGRYKNLQHPLVKHSERAKKDLANRSTSRRPRRNRAAPDRFVPGSENSPSAENIKGEKKTVKKVHGSQPGSESSLTSSGQDQSGTDSAHEVRRSQRARIPTDRFGFCNGQDGNVHIRSEDYFSESEMSGTQVDTEIIETSQNTSKDLDRLGYYADMEVEEEKISKSTPVKKTIRSRGQSSPGDGPVIDKHPSVFPEKRGKLIKRAVPFRAQGESILGDVDGWTGRQLLQLKEAHSTVDPTSATFWVAVAELVDDKSPNECHDKWFSVIKTPNVKGIRKGRQNQTVQKNPRPTSTDSNDDDDIFDSTPFRSNAPQSENHSIDVVGLPNFIDLGSAIKADTSATFADESGECYPDSEEHATLLEPLSKPGYKSYLDQMRRDAARARQTRKKKEKADGPPLPKSRTLVEAVYAGDVDLNARLSPGGTLKIRGMEIDEHDDFWDEMHNGDSEDEEMFGDVNGEI